MNQSIRHTESVHIYFYTSFPCECNEVSLVIQSEFLYWNVPPWCTLC